MKWEKVGDTWVVYGWDLGGKPNVDPVYQIHSADRRVGDNTGKWLALYDDEKGGGGYLAWAPDGSEIWYCGGNALWNAVGVPAEAEFGSFEAAKDMCEFHSIAYVAAWHSRNHPLLEKFSKNS